MGGCYCDTLPNFLKIPNNLQATWLGGGCYCDTLPNFLKIPNNLQATRLVGGGCCVTLLIFKKSLIICRLQGCMVVTVPLCLLFSKYLIICRLQGLGGGCYCVTLPKFKNCRIERTGSGLPVPWLNDKRNQLKCMYI